MTPRRRDFEERDKPIKDLFLSPEVRAHEEGMLLLHETFRELVPGYLRHLASRGNRIGVCGTFSSAT